MAIPTSEPDSLRIGDTWQWRREDLSDYPASAWTLTYYFRNATAYFDVTATADGDAFAVTVAKATTALRAAGDYDWAAFAISATERHEVDSGKLTLLPDLATAAPFDARTDAEQLLAAVNAELSTMGSSGQVRLVTVALDNRQLTYDTRGLIALRSLLISEVNRERNAAAKARDGTSRNRLQVRFG